MRLHTPNSLVHSVVFALAILYFLSASDPTDAQTLTLNEALLINPDANITAILSSVPVTATHSVEKINYFSELFIGAPYSGSPLGEGELGLVDKKPLFDLRSFDCMTFVEQVIALSISHDADEFISNLMHIRYKNGEINFKSRNHFVVADWLVNNEWLLDNITTKIGSNYSHRMYKNIDNTQFLSKFGVTDTIEHKLLPLDFIPHAYILKLTDKLCTSDIICFVTRKRNIFVDHMGFVIIKNNRVYLRHASKLSQRVKDELLATKIQTLSQQKYSAGVIILRLKPKCNLSKNQI
ncbi:DUF1460 domain-containing protein [candidate division KSB1 bacterium]|nr:DUF1460 domain-containing protein [candidate division KSB1 bacterium]